MKMIIRLSKKEELKAVPLLLRHSPGMMLRGRLYVLSAEAVQALRDHGIRFALVSSEAINSGIPGVDAGERV